MERNDEIVTFFYTILGTRVHAGMSPEEARKEAYDAVTLRYGIGRGRLLNIISNQKGSRMVNNSAFRENAISLIRELQIANTGFEAAMNKNERLIALLKECVEDVR